jgi:hypothetical protein
MSVKISTELMLDVVLSMPTLNKAYLLFIYLLSIIDNLTLMQILASDKIQEYVLKQMLIRTVNADNLMGITVSIPLYSSYIFFFSCSKFATLALGMLSL